MQENEFSELNIESWPGGMRMPLESVVSTAELHRRPSREPNYATENKALAYLMLELANSPKSVLQKIVDTVLNLFGAQSAGISILEEKDGKKFFKWYATAGNPIPKEPISSVAEVLLIPFHRNGIAIGTIWVVAHDESHKFDSEDERLMKSLGNFASSASQVLITEKLHDHSTSIIESSDDGIISKNLNSIVTSWNRGAEQIFGYKAEEVIGKSILLLIPPDRHCEEPEILARLQRGERIDHYETVRQRKDGKLIDVSLTVSPLMDTAGKVIGASKIARDITEQKKTQESLAQINQELKELTATLEDRVEERTLLLEEQSEKLRRLAVELIDAEENERKRLAQVLHDHLQQLLVAAKMKIDLIQRRETNLIDKDAHNDLRKYIDEAFDSSRSLTAALRPPVLYEGGLIPALRFLVRKFYDQYQFKIETSLGSDAEPTSNFLRAMIYSTVQEIIFNAVKYAKVNECFLELKRMPNNDIRVIVQDKGHGFSVENIDRKGSVGFGLFSIRERMKALGGEFKIESSIGNGARFEINIPDRQAAEEEIPDCEETEPTVENLNKKKSNGLKVLLVDDHKILRQSLANLLVSQPFIDEIWEAEDGQDVVDKLRYTNPDIIIMDLNMPHLNGIEATRIIHQSHPNIKIIGLSIQIEPETMQAMKDSGAVGYFNKGEDTEVLIETLKDFLKPALRLN